jgi:hypothetical protein
MANYIIKPVVFEAVRWWRARGGHAAVVPHAMCRIPGGGNCSLCGKPERQHGFLLDAVTGKTSQKVCPGDYIVTKADGTVHACAPKDFEATCVPYTEDAASAAVTQQVN